MLWASCYGKAEGTARTKALRWDNRESSKANALREGREEREGENGGQREHSEGFGFYSTRDVKLFEGFSAESHDLTFQTAVETSLKGPRVSAKRLNWGDS